MKNKKYLFCNIAVFLLVLFFVAYFSFLSFGRHDSLKSYLNDLGTYDQVIWNTAHGNFFDNSANMLNARNYLGAHFSPILLLFVPFYAIFASPKWLLFFQALAVGIGSIPIYLFAKEKLRSSGAGLVFLFSFLSYPVLHNSILYDFHEVVFAIPFASFAFYFLEKRNDKWFIIFSILLALSQEHMVLLVLAMGLYAAFIQKRWKFGGLVSFVSLGYFFLVLMVLMPFFSKTGSSALIANSSQYASRYAWLGVSFPEIIKKIFLSPGSILVALLNPEKLKFLFTLLLPILSLSLFSAPFLLIIPILLINFLSSNSMTYSPYFYHSATLIPFLLFAAIVTFQKWFEEDVFIKRLFLVLIILASIGSCIEYTVSPLGTKYHLADYLPDSHAKKIVEIKKIISAEASLSVQHNLGAHFSERKELYRFPFKANEVDYIILDQVDPYLANEEQVFKFDYALQMDRDEWKRKIEELRGSDSFEKIYDEDGWLVFRRR